MSDNFEVIFRFTNEKDVLIADTGLIYDFELEADKLRLIIDTLKSLPLNACIICQVNYTMGKNARVQLLFTSLSQDFLYTRSQKHFINETEYILSGTLKENLFTLTDDFISMLKENRMVGACFISVKLLLEKITNWIGDRSQNDLALTIFEQSELPKDFNYTQDSFDDLCSTYSKEAKDCALHIIYYPDIIINDNGNRVFVPKLLDDKGKEIGIAKQLFHETLAKSDIKLLIKFTVNNKYYNESITLLCIIIKYLKDTIYSLEIDLRELHLVRRSYVKVDKVLREIPNLRILKLSDGYIQWKPFLSCIKSITTLEELDLSDIRMLTNLFDGSDSDSEEEDQEEFVENFRNIWSESLKDLKGLRIAGYKSVLSYNEDDELDLVETVLPCLEHFTQLQSFGCTADRTYDTHMERFIRFLPYLENITKLDLSGSNLGNFDELESVAVILRALPNLKELNLSNCQLEMRFFEIMQLPIQNLRMLKFLDLSNNEDFYPVDIQIIKRLFNSLLLKIDD